MPRAFMNIPICALAAVRLALSPWRMTFTATRLAISPMMVITTSISISVTPRSDSLRLFFFIWLVSDGNIVDACDRQHQAHDQAPHHQAHHEDDDGLKQRREA